MLHNPQFANFILPYDLRLFHISQAVSGSGCAQCVPPHSKFLHLTRHVLPPSMFSRTALLSQYGHSFKLFVSSVSLDAFIDYPYAD